MRPLPLVLLGLLLSACVSQEEIERAVAEQQQADCLAAGFETSSDAYKLCLLLQQTNRRIETVERRLSYIELNQRRFETIAPRWWWN
jgi:hypothetical protein